MRTCKLAEDQIVDVVATASLAEACDGATGLINCTPLGMVGYGGNAFAGIPLKGRAWIFDAIYTPLETPFLKEGEAAVVEALSGYELFLYQGIHAFKLFTGHLSGREDAAEIEAPSALDLDIAVCVGALGMEQKDIKGQGARRPNRLAAYGIGVDRGEAGPLHDL